MDTTFGRKLNRNVPSSFMTPRTFTYGGLTVEVEPPTPEEIRWLEVTVDNEKHLVPFTTK